MKLQLYKSTNGGWISILSDGSTTIARTGKFKHCTGIFLTPDGKKLIGKHLFMRDALRNGLSEFVPSGNGSDNLIAIQLKKLTK